MSTNISINREAIPVSPGAKDTRYKLLFLGILLGPVVVITGLITIELITNIAGTSTLPTFISLLLLLGTSLILIIWNYSLIPFFLYSIFFLFKALKARSSTSIYLMCATSILVIPVMYLVPGNAEQEYGKQNIQTASENAKDVINRPWTHLSDFHSTIEEDN